MTMDSGMDELKAHLEQQIRWKVDVENRLTNLERAQHEDRLALQSGLKESTGWTKKFFFALLAWMLTSSVLVVVAMLKLMAGG